MRRKLFFCSILLFILILIILTLATDHEVENLDNSYSKNHVARVVSIDKHDKGWQFIVKLNDGNKVLVKYYGDKMFSQNHIGSIVAFDSALELPNSRRNPRCFDYRMYLRSLGIMYIAKVDDIETLGFSNNYYDRYCQFLLSKRENFLDSIKDLNTRNFIDGILFGNIDNLDEDTYEEFKQNGTAHILAVSGLHIGIVYQIIQRLLGKRLSIFNFFITTGLMWSLGILTGWTPSVIRAVGMIVIKNLALLIDKRYDSLTAIGLIAICMMVKNPYIVFNVSFQMSFLAVISIIFLTPRFPKFIPDFLVIIMAVNIGLLPYQIFQFNTFSVTSFLANIPIVYLSGILLPISFAQFVLFMITGINLDFLAKILTLFIIYINKLCTFGLETINVVGISLWVLIIIYCAGFFAISETVFLLVSRKKIKTVSFSLVAIFIFAACTNFMFFTDFDRAEIVFLDVGQGDCVHVKAGDKNILIDGGGRADYEVGEKTVMPYLLKNGIRKVDLAVATHRHTDHYKGLMELRTEHFIDEVQVDLCAGKTFKIDEDIWIETLWPIKSTNEDIDVDENKNCSVFMINYRGKKILITGDLDAEGEKELLKHYKGRDVLKADILKVGHHGSRFSTSIDFLNVVSPKYCVIQVGKNNYGHPHAKTIEKCEEKCIMILRNDMHGAIGFSLDEEQIEYCTMIKADGK